MTKGTLPLTLFPQKQTYRVKVGRQRERSNTQIDGEEERQTDRDEEKRKTDRGEEERQSDKEEEKRQTERKKEDRQT